MTLSEIQQDVYARCNYGTSPSTAVVNRITRFINQRHRVILADRGMERLRDDQYSLTSTSGTAIYAMPQALARIKHITQRTNNIPLEPQSLAWLRMVDPGLTATGGPAYAYIELGTRQVAQQPSDASEIFVKSTSASDTGTAYIEGVRTGGYRRSLSVSMTGVTAVSLGTAITDFIEIDKFYISAAAVGTVTLHEDSGAGTELARIPIGGTFARYQTVQLWPTPTGEVYVIDYTRKIPDLVNANDEPLLPEDFHSSVLATWAEADEWRHLNDKREQAALDAVGYAQKNLRNWVLNPPGYLPTPGDYAPRFSRLGPWYPAGT